MIGCQENVILRPANRCGNHYGAWGKTVLYCITVVKQGLFYDSYFFWSFPSVSGALVAKIADMTLYFIECFVYKILATFLSICERLLELHTYAKSSHLTKQLVKASSHV
ncbi:hypothetical protein PDJAM_G00023500 [Pangasius djambal]|uniref:Uncharacterized protein n=1 Tax=Pangasius djambal TaxID=1691987 RepID=A0ACC5YNK3_9TELE|nr:hypothetical protein [Pangasius djambal]